MYNKFITSDARIVIHTLSLFANSCWNLFLKYDKRPRNSVQIAVIMGHV